jgi:hypothetical protein
LTVKAANSANATLGAIAPAAAVAAACGGAEAVKVLAAAAADWLDGVAAGAEMAVDASTALDGAAG